MHFIPLSYFPANKDQTYKLIPKPCIVCGHEEKGTYVSLYLVLLLVLPILFILQTTCPRAKVLIRRFVPHRFIRCTCRPIAKVFCINQDECDFRVEMNILTAAFAQMSI
ncbi:hypothetical protein C8J56DRAFT_1173792 [Mycena floridula]|nr:hypothetical protein C8J56DRAFT_1173792 [Mycena floridula]